MAPPGKQQPNTLNHEAQLLELLELTDLVSKIDIPAPTSEFKAVARTRMLNMINSL